MDLIWIITIDDGPDEGGYFIDAPCWRTADGAREAFNEAVRTLDPKQQEQLFAIDRDQVPMKPGQELRQKVNDQDAGYPRDLVLTCQRLRTDFRDVKMRAQLAEKEEKLANLKATMAGLEAGIAAIKRELGEE